MPADSRPNGAAAPNAAVVMPCPRIIFFNSDATLGVGKRIFALSLITWTP